MVESDGSHKNDLTVVCKVYSVQVKLVPVSDVGLCVKKTFHVDLD